MLTVLAVSLPVFALIALGAAFGRLRKIGPIGIKALNGFTVWLALPALLFLSLAIGDWSPLDQPGFLIAFAGSTVAAFGVGLFVCLPRRLPLADRALAALAASYSNTAFIGIPLLTALIGAVGKQAAVIATLVTVSALFALAVLIVEASLHHGHRLRAIQRTAIGVASNPLFTAPVAGALWHVSGLALPTAIARPIGLLGASASPCALVTIGAFLALPGRRAPVRPLGIALGIKLIAQPLIALALIRVAAAAGFPLPREWAIAAVVLAALPVGTGPFMLAELYEREAALASRAILLSTILGAATVSAIAALLLA